MNFEEKIDGNRTTPELAILDIEAQRTSMQELHAGVQELRLLSAHQHESIQDLMKISDNLVKSVLARDRRIGAIEGRI
jgi:hypothetical protein